MSRSYCKPHTPFNIAYIHDIDELKRDTYSYHDNWNYARNVNNKPHRWFETWADLTESKWKYTTKKHTCHRHSHRFPKTYRKIVNNSRRNYDKRELFKEINLIDYDAVYSKWNCKDADPYWYW